MPARSRSTGSTDRGPTPPGASIDEDAAWALARASVRSPVGRVFHPRAKSLWLDLDGDGGWLPSHTPSEPARGLLDLFLPLALTRDLVIGQLGQSLDGRIATEAGRSHYITGLADIRRLHRLRALVDAVVVGAATVALDDPRLTVREVEGQNPARVVLDPDGRVGADRALFTDAGARTFVLRRPGLGAPPPNAELIELPAEKDGFAPAAILQALRTRGLRRVLVEGGGVTVSRFLQAGVLDRLHVTVAPLLIGSGRPSFTLPPIATLDQALRPRCRTFRLGDDLLFDLDLR